MGFLQSPILEPCLLTPTRKAARSLRKKRFAFHKSLSGFFPSEDSPGPTNLALRILGDLYTFKLTGEALSVAELTAFPQNGPPPHIHQREDESFWVLDGEFSVLLGERTLTTGQGAFVHFPKGCCTLTRIPAEIALAPTYHLQ